MDNHFKGVNETERFNNELLSETKRTNELLEQLVQLLQPKVEKSKPVGDTNKRTYPRGKRNGNND